MKSHQHYLRTGIFIYFFGLCLDDVAHTQEPPGVPQVLVERGTGDEQNKLFLRWYAEAGLTYTLQRSLSGNIDTQTGSWVWDETGDFIYGLGADVRLHVATMTPPPVNNGPPADSQLNHVPLLNVMFQPLAGQQGGVVVSWNSGSTVGSTNARQVYPSGDLTHLPIIGVYRTEDINVFWTNISVNHPLNVSDVSTLNSSLSVTQQLEWATIQSSMDAILSVTSTPSTLDTPGQALETNRAAMFWRFNVEYPDTDGDGIEDWKEIAIHHTNPFNADTDGDGFTDAEELRLGTDFNDSSSKPAFLYNDPATPDPAEVHIQRWLASGWVLDEDGQHQDAKWFTAYEEKNSKSWTLNGSEVNARMREGVAWLQSNLNKCEFGPAISDPDLEADVTNLVASYSRGHPDVQCTLSASTDWYHPYTYDANDKRAAMRIIAAQTAASDRTYTYLVCKNKYSGSESESALRSPDVMGSVTFTIPAGKLLADIVKSDGVTDDVVKIKNNVLYLAAPLTESVAEGTDENYTWVFLTPVELAVDNDRDGLVTFGTDTTSTAKPFRFWINDDHDHGTNTEDLTGDRNCDDGIINGIRDLEDFTIVKMKIPQSVRDMLTQQSGKIGFRWKDTSGGSPACRMFTGSPSLAKAKDYLSDEGAAETVRAQNNQIGNGNATLISGSSTAWLRTSLLPEVQSNEISLLMEGCAVGKGKLTLVIKLGSQEVDGASVDVQFLRVGEMYDRGRITVDAPGIPDPWANPHPPDLAWQPDTASGSPKPDPDAKAKTIIWTHGWRMDYAEYASWADTSFKRLWQMGFKGRFYAFRWPTYSAENDGWPNLESLDITGQWADAGQTFNPSEYRAWLSGPALANFVNQTPNAGSRYFMAHSLGNVTAASALNSGMSVKKYALLNAAMASMAYDGVHIPADTDADFVTIDTDPSPLAAAFWGLANRVKYAGTQLVNFGLPLDAALGKWTSNNQNFRPQWWADLSGYGYDRPEPDPNKKLYYGPLAAIGIGFKRIFDTDAEAFGYCVQARTRAAGCKLGTGNMSATVDMRDYSNATEHSAEWVRPFQTIYPFWKRLMEEFNEDLSNR